ncbi:uncharacterized protein BT62DRAFT_1013156 [Guyanagaster necrorhizus]|uniref:Uncharacterized protein n=1 Tax=Guyanagaster necrorhizus TaxID=856835 RepID=A0A9P7VFI8_9AGAR|nr:uncharacterized protein BT62DRAFT_1013156 [Guyanagaster necrorhizus MCA 3950]KAG7440011.1 hypothetical protein BT62DRAFT_1013156 [Guyanagaster necrorhizus MCA 3950]
MADQRKQRSYTNSKRKTQPWQSMVDTYIWVEEQRWATAQWVFEQQMRTIYGAGIDEKQRAAAERHRADEHRQTVEEIASRIAGKRSRRSRTKERPPKMTWTDYQARWQAVHSSSSSLSFSSIPWPQRIQPATPSDISPAAIASFIFAYPGTQSRKERIRSAQLTWHPDRFQRLLGRVVEEEREKVGEGAGIVARALNDLK